MFTGIVETVGIVEDAAIEGGNMRIWVRSSLANELRRDQSLCHDGVCLTVEDLRPGAHRVAVIAETLSKTSLGRLQSGARVNLERALPANGRLDGHFVLGHADTRGRIAQIRDLSGSRELEIAYAAEFSDLVVARGSICVNGISLTIARLDAASGLTVCLIPYTMEHTNIGDLRPADDVNLEFDVLGKYVRRKMDRAAGS